MRLFGSRTDDPRRGGDIDLHIEVDPAQAALKRKFAFLVRLDELLGDQKIDVVPHGQGEPLWPIDRIAMKTGAVI